MRAPSYPCLSSVEMLKSEIVLGSHGVYPNAIILIAAISRAWAGAPYCTLCLFTICSFAFRVSICFECDVRKKLIDFLATHAALRSTLHRHALFLFLSLLTILTSHLLQNSLLLGWPVGAGREPHSQARLGLLSY